MNVEDEFTIFVNGYNITVNVTVSDYTVPTTPDRPSWKYEYEEIGNGAVEALETVREELEKLDDPTEDFPYGAASFAVGDLRIEHHHHKNVKVKDADGELIGELTEKQLRDLITPSE